MRKYVKLWAIAALTAGLADVSLAGSVRVREAQLWTEDRVQAFRLAKAAAPVRTQASAARRAVVAMRARLGVDATAADLRLRRADTDAFGRTHVRLQQLYKGVEVDGRELIVHFDATDAVYEVNGDWLTGLALDVVPSRAGGEGAELVIYCPSDDAAAARLVWRTRVGHRIVFTDAQTGKVLHTHRATPQAPAMKEEEENDDDEGAQLFRILDAATMQATTTPFPAGTAATLIANLPPQQGGAAVEINVTQGTDSKTYLTGTTADGIEVGVLDGCAAPKHRDATRAAAAANVDWLDDFLAATGWTTWSDDPDEDMPNAIAILHNVTTVLDFYKSAFNRLSYDGKGGRIACWRFWQLNTTNLDRAYRNAFWAWTERDSFMIGCFFFGYDLSGKRSETSLDCCAHELTHGVMMWTANFQSWEAEPGALCESFSDLLAAACEFAAQPRAADTQNPNPGEADWLFDEDSGQPLRSFADPQLFHSPSRYKGKYWVNATDTAEGNGDGGAHLNCGVQNFFFYLLTEGGQGTNDGVKYDVEGIGIEKAAQLAYLTLTAYCSPRTDYAAVTSCWDSAAQDLVENGVLTEADRASVAAAWDAVMSQPAHGSAIPDGTGEAIYALEDLALIKVSKANAAGRIRVTATLAGISGSFTGWLENGQATLTNRRYQPMTLTLDTDFATLSLEDETLPVPRVSPVVGEVDGLETLRVGVAAAGAAQIIGDAQKVRYSARQMPRGVRIVARSGAFTGVPTKAGSGKATIAATCTIPVAGRKRPLKAKVARKAKWAVAPLDDYAQGTFLGEGTRVRVTKAGRLSGFVTVNGRRRPLSAKSYKSYTDGAYATSGKMRGGLSFIFITTEQTGSLLVTTAAGDLHFTVKKQ